MNALHERPVRFLRLFLPLLLLVFLTGPPVSAQALQPTLGFALAPGITTRVSVASDGTQANSYSESPSISPSGRYVAFESYATNLVSSDANEFCDFDGNGDPDNCPDIFVHDRLTGQSTLVSVASDGVQGNNYSLNPWISANGRFVAFSSLASNLVSGDTNFSFDAFLHDRRTAQTTRVSVASDGSQGTVGGYASSISGDGRYMVISSASSNLVEGDNNGYADVFVHDVWAGQTTRISVASDGSQGNGSSGGGSISADGRFVAFGSYASNLVSDDTKGYFDVFVHDRATDQTMRLSVASDGSEGDGASGVYRIQISANGRYVAFDSDASNLVQGDTNSTIDIFVHDRKTGRIKRVSVASDGMQANGGSYYADISANGQFVVFQSDASNLVAGDTNALADIFVHDRQTGDTTRVSVASDGTQADNRSQIPSISGNGGYVAFESDASNLASGDTNGQKDIFVHDRLGAGE